MCEQWQSVGVDLSVDDEECDGAPRDRHGFRQLGIESVFGQNVVPVVDLEVWAHHAEAGCNRLFQALASWKRTAAT